MPRKGGGGQTPPEDAEEEDAWINPETGRAAPGGADRAAYDDEVPFMYGDIVHDEEPDDPEDMVVVNLPDKVISQWEVDGGTLADQNPGCRPEDDVIIVVLLEELDKYMPDWDEREEEIPLEQLEEDDVTYQPYPSLRLDREEDSHLR